MAIEIFKLCNEENINTNFEGNDFSNLELDDVLFDSCTFKNCSFVNTKFRNSNMENSQFISCEIINADFSASKLQDIQFLESKIVGLNLYKCNQTNFDFVFEKSKIEYCNFSDVHMKRTVFRGCEIIESFFQNTFLVEAVFNNTIFSNTSFFKCNLKKANFTDASGYVIDPQKNSIEKATFSLPGVLGLLHGFDIKIV